MLDVNIPGKSGATFSAQTETTFSFRIFPNPATDLVYIESSSLIQGIEIFQSSGKSVLHKSGLSAFSTKLDLTSLSPGLYLLRLKMEDKTAISSKLVIR